MIGVYRRIQRRQLITERQFVAMPGDHLGDIVTFQRWGIYDSILGVFSERPRCAGMFWWKWFSEPAANVSSRNRYDFPPAGKPAEDVLARWYGRMKTDRG